MRHDLKTPLSAFINIPPMLMGDCNLTSAQKEMMSLLGAAGKKMLGQINASLELIKIEQGNYKQKKQECRPVELINEIIDMLTTSKGLSGDVVCFHAIMLPEMPTAVSASAPMFFFWTSS